MDSEPKKILIVEDEKPLAKALELKLTHAGFIISVCLNGEEALSLIAENQYDLILLDLIMPKVNGFSVLQKIKEQNINTPVIVSSNLSQAEDINKAKDLGALQYFVKSNTSLAQIISYITDALNK